MSEHLPSEKPVGKNPRCNEFNGNNVKHYIVDTFGKLFKIVLATFLN